MSETPHPPTDPVVCPWCKATGADPCRTSDGRRRVPHKARSRMRRALRGPR